jgi:hypothetical protein
VYKKGDIKREEKKKFRDYLKKNNQNIRSLTVTLGIKRVEYFPEENIVIKGFGSATNPLDIADENTEIYSDDENRKGKNSKQNC